MTYIEHEILKSLHSCWQRFAGNHFWRFLAGKHKIKFLLQGLICQHFKLQMNSFRNKISRIRHTSKNLSLCTPVMIMWKSSNISDLGKYEGDLVLLIFINNYICNYFKWNATQHGHVANIVTWWYHMCITDFEAITYKEISLYLNWVQLWNTMHVSWQK